MVFCQRDHHSYRGAEKIWLLRECFVIHLIIHLVLGNVKSRKVEKVWTTEACYAIVNLLFVAS